MDYINKDIFISQVWGWIKLPRTSSKSRIWNRIHYVVHLHKPGEGIYYITKDIFTSQVWECITIPRKSSQARFGNVLCYLGYLHKQDVGIYYTI